MTSVSLCIPAYQAEDFVTAAIDSALAQTHQDVKVLVGADVSSDRTAERCLRYADDPRVTVLVHEQRQGWAGNANSLLDLVETDTYGFVFHDDTVAPRYAEVLVGLLDGAPDAVLASGALQLHGAVDMVRRFSELRGDTMQRMVTALTVPEAMQSMKSLARSDLVRAGLRLRADQATYHADHPFFLAHAAAGESVFVDEVLYYKRIWDGSVTGGWRRLSSDDLFERRVAMLADAQRIIAGLDLPAEDKRVLHALALTRGLSDGVTEELPADSAVASHDLRTAAAVMAHLLGELPAAGARPRSDHEQEVTRAVAASRHRLGLAAGERGADPAVVASLHALATTDGNVANLTSAEHVRVGRALSRGHDGHELADLALQHARAVPESDRERGNALEIEIRAHVARRRWSEASRLLGELRAAAPDTAARMDKLSARVERGLAGERS